MADQMQAIKRRMKSVSSTERITNAMKLVSAAKLKQATNRFNYAKENLERLSEQFEEILRSEEKADAVYTEEREGKVLYFVLSGSKGLCGSYNSSVMKEIEKYRQTACFVPLGSKGREFCVREKMEIFEPKGLENVPIDALEYTQIAEICRQALKRYRDGSIAKIGLVYTAYVNSIVHEVRVKELLPFTPEDPAGNGNVGDTGFMEYEPDSPEFFDCLAEEYLTLKLYSAIAESTLCEHSARRMAMKNASDNAKEMLTELSVYYNRARQAAITSEIIEIIAGAEAQK